MKRQEQIERAVRLGLHSVAYITEALDLKPDDLPEIFQTMLVSSSSILSDMEKFDA